MTSHSNADRPSWGVDSDFAEAIQLPPNSGLINLPDDSPGEGASSFRARLGTAFSELIADELSRELPLLPHAVSQDVKVWLYNTGQPWALQDYEVPYFDRRDLEISSSVALSQLERIYVLSNGRSGQEYEDWKAACEAWLRPLFLRFIAPQDPPDVLNEFMVMRFGQMLSDKLYLGLNMQNNMRFNALVIQAD